MERKLFLKFFCRLLLLSLACAGIVHSAHAQQVCRNFSSNGSVETVCKQPNGDWVPSATSPVTNTDPTTDPAASTTPSPASPPAQQQSNAPANPLPLSSSNWTATEVDGNFAETGTSGQQKIAMVLPKNSQHFELFLTGFQTSIPAGSTVAFAVQFDNGKSMSFSGQSDGTNLQANLNDSDVGTWTHNISADQIMTISFTGIDENPWSIPLSGTTPTITAMAEGMTQAGITGLPTPWNTDATTSSPPTQSALPSPSSVNASPNENQANNNIVSAPQNQTPSSILTFTNPDGIAYANLGETTWTTNKSYDEMTDQTVVTVVSNQQNDTGVTAQVTGACSNGIVTFTATIADSSGQPTVNLANETLAEDLPYSLTGAVGYVRGQLRIDSNAESQFSFLLPEYNNTPQIAQLSVGGESTGDIVLKLDLRSTWRILAKVDTDHGSILIKIPIYDSQVESFIMSCVASNQSAASSKSTGHLGVIVKYGPLNNGALIVTIIPNGPASIAGLQAGDLIDGVNGQTIRGPDDLANVIGNIIPGQKATIEFTRDGQDREITVAIGG